MTNEIRQIASRILGVRKRTFSSFSLLSLFHRSVYFHFFIIQSALSKGKYNFFLILRALFNVLLFPFNCYCIPGYCSALVCFYTAALLVYRQTFCLMIWITFVCWGLTVAGSVAQLRLLMTVSWKMNTLRWLKDGRFVRIVKCVWKENDQPKVILFLLLTHVNCYSLLLACCSVEGFSFHYQHITYVLQLLMIVAVFSLFFYQFDDDQFGLPKADHQKICVLFWENACKLQ